MLKYTTADTKTFLKLAGKAELPGFLRLKRIIDPDGMHVVWLSMLHNNVEVRASWMVKLTSTDEPHYETFSVPVDVFDKLPQVEPEDSEA